MFRMRCSVIYRVRFAKELVQEMRKAVGEDFVLAMRLSGDDLVPGSNTNEDAVKFAKEMEKVGIDLLNITGGWHESKVPQITGELPRGGFSFLDAPERARSSSKGARLSSALQAVPSRPASAKVCRTSPRDSPSGMSAVPCEREETPYIVLIFRHGSVDCFKDKIGRAHV